MPKAPTRPADKAREQSNPPPAFFKPHYHANPPVQLFQEFHEDLVVEFAMVRALAESCRKALEIGFPPDKIDWESISDEAVEILAAKFPRTDFKEGTGQYLHGIIVKLVLKEVRLNWSFFTADSLSVPGSVDRDTSADNDEDVDSSDSNDKDADDDVEDDVDVATADDDSDDKSDAPGYAQLDMVVPYPDPDLEDDDTAGSKARECLREIIAGLSPALRSLGNMYYIKRIPRREIRRQLETVSPAAFRAQMSRMRKAVVESLAQRTGRTKESIQLELKKLDPSSRRKRAAD